ncbi:VTT domain-containing protein [Candidatus Parcubacteria bacterium]|nr:VTT domain-containing protein [Patescibacteria group bacterium]MCG2688804.1 VTT domain-containing protein [Candidatus Parcubacteria bacterium]
MLEKLIQVTQSIVSAGGPAGVFMAAILEEIIFFIPSPIVPMAAGFFLLSSQVELAEAASRAILHIALPVSLGLTIGSLIPYYICYFGGRPAIEKWGRLIGLTWGNIEKTEQKFIRGYGDELILLGLRILPVVPSVAISGFCGFIRYPIFHFIVVTACGAAIRGFLLGLLGWYAGTAYLKYAQMIAQMEKYLFVLIGVVGVAVIVWFIRKPR